jgi:hypothetical protein
MVTIDIIPNTHKKDFIGPNGDTFYCNICKEYSADFSPSAIKYRERRCSPCLFKKRVKKTRSMTHLDILRRKLYQNLIYHKKLERARSINNKTVVKILRSHGVDDSEYNNVKTFKISKNSTDDTLSIHPIFF